MTTARQTEANQRNAQASTWAGKAAFSMNALRHGPPEPL